MEVSMQNWNDYTPLERMQAIYIATYRHVMGGDPPPVPEIRWNSLYWLSVATEKLIDEHLEVAEDLSKVLSNIGD